MNVKHKIRIAAADVVLYDYLMDVKNRSNYIPALEEVVLLQPPPIQKGSRYIEVSKIAGRTIKTTYEIVGLVPGSRIAAKTIESIFPIQVSLDIKKEGAGSILYLQLEFQLTGIFKFGQNIVKKIVDQQARDILRKIKRNIEFIERS